MKKILVVVDMQNDFVDGALGSKEAVAIVDNVVKKITEYRKNGDDIIVTYDTHSDDYMNSLEGKYLPVPHCIRGTYGWELNDDVQNALYDFICDDNDNIISGHKETSQIMFIHKPTFGSTVLPEQIKTLTFGQEFEIELVGLCTDICVISNALLLKANFHWVDISVDATCCAGVTPEKHNAALEVMRSCQINVMQDIYGGHLK